MCLYNVQLYVVYFQYDSATNGREWVIKEKQKNKNKM